MASEANTVERLLLSAMPGSSGGRDSLEAEMSRLSAQVQRLQTVQQAAVESVRANTQAVVAAQARSNKTERGGGGVGGTLLSVLGGGLGLSPLLTGLWKLLGRDERAAEPPPLVRFALPAARNVTAGVSERAREAFGIDYGQGGVPRAVMAPQVTVQVQAMDSRSFLDHSQEIARAVRQAMLESDVLQGVVREA